MCDCCAVSRRCVTVVLCGTSCSNCCALRPSAAAGSPCQAGTTTDSWQHACQDAVCSAVVGARCLLCTARARWGVSAGHALLQHLCVLWGAAAVACLIRYQGLQERPAAAQQQPPDVHSKSSMVYSRHRVEYVHNSCMSSIRLMPRQGEASDHGSSYLVITSPDTSMMCWVDCAFC